MTDVKLEAGPLPPGLLTVPASWASLCTLELIQYAPGPCTQESVSPGLQVVKAARDVLCAPGRREALPSSNGSLEAEPGPAEPGQS
jgi:hypothetical protein